MLAFDGYPMRRMDVATLVEQAELLSRPAVYLSPTHEGDQVGVWWGPSHGSGEHNDNCWLSLDCVLLPELGFSKGALEVVWHAHSGTGSAAVAASVAQRPAALAHPLRALRGRSLPPIDALFRFGSDVIGRWLETCGWQRDWGYNDNFPDGLARQYLHLFEQEHPLYTDSAWVVVGGWHFPWPDGDWASRLQDRLVVTTYRDSEPWLEVWATTDDLLQVKARTT